MGLHGRIQQPLARAISSEGLSIKAGVAFCTFIVHIEYIYENSQEHCLCAQDNHSAFPKCSAYNEMHLKATTEGIVLAHFIETLKGIPKSNALFLKDVTNPCDNFLTLAISSLRLKVIHRYTCKLLQRAVPATVIFNIQHIHLKNKQNQFSSCIHMEFGFYIFLYFYGTSKVNTMYINETLQLHS